MLTKDKKLQYRTKSTNKVGISLLSFSVTFALGLSTNINASPLSQLDSTLNLNDENNISSALIQSAKFQTVEPNSREGKLLNSFAKFYKKQTIKYKKQATAPSFLPQDTPLKKSLRSSPNENTTTLQTPLSAKGKLIKSDFTLKVSKVGTPTFIKGINKQAENLSPSYKIRFSPDEYTIKAKNLAFFDKYNSLLKLEFPEQELNIKKLYQDNVGQFHTKYTQQYKGIPVWKSQLTTHSNPLGDVIGMTGKFIPTPSNISTTPTISEEAAVNLAAGTQSININEVLKADSKLVIYSDKSHITPVLAWEIKLQTSPIYLKTVLINATSGKSIVSFDNIKSENVTGSGYGVFGESHKINVWHDSGSSTGQYSLNDASKSMFDGSTMNPLDFDEKKGVINVYDAKNEPASNELKDLKSYYRIFSDSSDQGWLADGVSASVNLSKIYDYYQTTFNRNSLDDKGGRITGLVRLGKNYNNAFWAGGGINMMFFGDGLKFAGGLDVVAHEVSHGVTDAESDLVYQDQPGAINESLSDIFGEMVERYVTGSNDWLMGTLLSEKIRSMKDPSLYNDPAKMSDYVTTTRDHGGVHTNSGIPNHAFYLLAEGGSYAIGHDDAAKIFYRANTTHLLPRSEFSDLRQACIQSADDLFGAKSKQSKSVASAFDAVEIYDSPTPTPTPGKPANAADSVINITAQNGKMYLGRYEKGLGDTDGGVYFASKEVGGHRPAVSGDGTTVAFISKEHDFCMADTKTAEVTCINENDSFFSAAFSPDDHYISIVLKDPNKDHAGLPTIYLLDLTKKNSDFVEYKLKAAKIDDSSSDNKIDTVDAMDFSANGRYLVYDALNTFTVNNKQVGAWSIYALDLQTNKTLALIKPKANRQVGFPSLSNINNNLMAFDFYDADTKVVNISYADLSTGKVFKVAESSAYTAPSFTGDDKSLVYSVEDSSSAIGYSLHIKPLSGGSAKKWISNAYQGVVYRRGTIKKPASVDLQVLQTVRVTANSNDSVTFKITVKNTGSDKANNVVLINNFTTGLSLTGSAPAGCKKINAQKVECKTASLNSGSEKTYELVLKAIKTGDQSNSAQVASSEEDSNINNNTNVLKFKVSKTGGGSSNGGGGSSKSGGGSMPWLILAALLFMRRLKIAY